MASPAEAPILMQIHDKFDRYPRYPHTDHSVISKMELTSSPNGYRITTYPGGSGTMFDRLVLTVFAEGGIFSVRPQRIETSRNSGGSFGLSIETADPINEDGGVLSKGKVDYPAQLEELILPGYDGFKLFRRLHRELQELKAPLEDLMKVVNPCLKPVTVSFEEVEHAVSLDDERRLRSVIRKDRYKVGDGEGNTSQIDMDASFYQEFVVNWGIDKWNYIHRFPGYKSGVAVNQNGGTTEKHELDPLVVHGFSWLRAYIEGLYSPR